MEEQKILAKRIEFLCKEKNLSYYELSYKAAVPLTTLMHIMDGSTKNPGLFTISKICGGLRISLKDFFDTQEFEGIEEGLE
ncbi:MAG: helix-turn-helix domain-containing protein [Lachnospiraceae bacterium]|nr:helix-turn-helix domain-containing protein [Lachnospiraceae bacterium]MCI9589734.1 helix-turn-helix domain-containing protein [Lachnospiraceae bacterium]